MRRIIRTSGQQMSLLNKRREDPTNLSIRLERGRSVNTARTRSRLIEKRESLGVENMIGLPEMS